MNEETLKHHWEAYLLAYREVDEDKRRLLLEKSVANDLIFTNPGGQGSGREGLVSHIDDLQKNMPGVRFETERLFVHHDELLAVWTMHNASGEKLATGYNFVRPDASGRFAYMAGFFRKDA